MDCEGYEYQSLLSTDIKYLKIFDQYGIEYHYGAEVLERLFIELKYSVRVDTPKNITIGLASHT
jgi:hypothetical protein